MQIYKITNRLNSKIYIGKDTTSNPNYYGSGAILNHAIKKYGIENFTKEIIDTAETKADLAEKEKYWISFCNSTDKEIGYNISRGGDGGDTISNNPNRDTISKKLSENSPTKGKTYEEAYGAEKALEYRKKLSESHKYRNPRAKKEKPAKVDQRKIRWKAHHESKKKNTNFIFENILGKIRKTGVISNLEEIDDLKKNRYKLGISNVKDFYEKFHEFGEEIMEYYNTKEYNTRSKVHSGRPLEEHAKEKIRLKLREKFINDLNNLIETIEKNSINLLEDYFDKKDCNSIRKRFLKNPLADKIPEKYRIIMSLLPERKKPNITKDGKNLGKLN